MNLDKKLLGFLRDQRMLLFVSVGFGVLTALLIVLQAWLLSQVVNRVFLDNASLTNVQNLLVALLFIFLLRALFNSASSLSASSLGIKIKTRLRADLFEHIIRLGPIYTRAQRTGELTSLFVEGIESVEVYFSQYLPGLVLAALVPLTYLIFIFPLDTLTGIILLVTAPLIPVFMLLIGGQSQALTQRQWRSLSRMSAYFLDVIQGLKTLKALGRSKDQSHVIAQVSDRYRKTTMSVLRVTFLSALVLELVATISIAIIAVEIGLRLLYGGFIYQHALFLLLLAPEFYLPLRSLGARFHAGMSGISASSRIFEVFDTPANFQTSRAAPSPASVNPDTARFNHALASPQIKFKDVGFDYPGGRLSLHEVGFTILPGQMAALVGRSGSGKSTIADFLLRFNEPGKGSITVNGKSLLDFPREEWLTHIAWVPQNPYLFNDNIFENIRLSAPQASPGQVQQAARQANAHAFIQEFPEGYDTLVGEQGAKLSRGQIQRIAMARAFLKNAPLLILDEPAANLDPHNEHLLAASLNRLAGSCTTFVIAHRLSTVGAADQVIHLEDGKVLETGAHSQLLESGGSYSSMMLAASQLSPQDAAGISEPSPDHKSKDNPPTQLAGTFQPGPVSPPTQPDPFSLLGQMDPKSALITLVRLIRLMSPNKWSVGLSILTGFATIASGIGLMGTSAYIISAAALAPSIAELQLAIVGVRFFGISRSLLRYLERNISHQTTFKLLARFRVWFYNALEPLVPARTTSYTSGDLLGRLQGDIQSLESFYVRGIAPPMVAVLVTLLLGFFMYLVAPVLGIVLSLFMTAGGLFLPVTIRYLGKNAGRRTVKKRALLNTLLVDGIQGLPDLLVYQAEGKHTAGIKNASADLAAAQLALARLEALQSSSVLFLSNLCMWSLLVLALPLVTGGALSGVYLAALILAALSAFEAVIPIPQAAQYLEANIMAARRLFEVVDAPPEISQSQTTLSVPSEYKIRISNLGFRYPLEIPHGSPLSIDSIQHHKSPQVLDRINFMVDLGAHMALVGASGGGKSTVASLLLRFWEYGNNSTIQLDGGQLRAYNPDELRRSYGCLLQDDYIFNASIRENLLIARPSASCSEIEKAAEDAQLHRFIAKLPDGYATLVGERGLLLSAGERQRLCLARVFLSDAPFLLLDEATAHLDGITERAVMSALKRYTAGRSLLMITHRLNCLEWMDEILVLERGRLVERGTYDRLLSRDSLFRQMWELERQALFE